VNAEGGKMRSKEGGIKGGRQVNAEGERESGKARAERVARCDQRDYQGASRGVSEASECRVR
jgi:hypothetical protein